MTMRSKTKQLLTDMKTLLKLSDLLRTGHCEQAGYPIGFIESKMRSLLPEDDPRSYRPASARPSDVSNHEAQKKMERPVHYPPLSSDALQGVIQQMEGGLRKR